MIYKIILVWIGRLAGLACFILAAMMAADASNSVLMATPDHTPDRQMLFVFSAITVAAVGLVLLVAAEVLDSVVKARNG